GHVLGLVPRRRLPRHVHDRRRARDESLERPRLPHVAGHDLRRGALQPAGVLGTARERAHAVARREKGVGDVAAHETSAPREGDEITARHRESVSLDYDERLPMRTCLPGLALALTLAAPAFALEAPRKLVDYAIYVTVDPDLKTVDGRETLKWTNPSDAPVAALRFHLYWNAFRNDRSTFFKESGGQLRGDKADTGKGWGYTDVTSVKWDGFELVKAARFESPDDGNPDDRTVLVVPLPRPVVPGETATLAIAWKAKVPRVYARAGYVRDFFMFGQWF